MADVATNPIRKKEKTLSAGKGSDLTSAVHPLPKFFGILLLLQLLELFPILIFHIETGLEDPFAPACRKDLIFS